MSASRTAYILPLLAREAERIAELHADSRRSGPYLTDDDLALAIVGSRKLHSPAVAERLAQAVDLIARLHARPTAIVSGGAGGVDYLASEYARAHELGLVVHRPRNADRKGDYLLRNTAIVREAHIVLALPAEDSRGTWDTVRKAVARERTTYVLADAAVLADGGFSHARHVEGELYELHVCTSA